jgi:hypothetical protein
MLVTRVQIVYVSTKDIGNWIRDASNTFCERQGRN